jgi:hypothetical protein
MIKWLWAVCLLRCALSELVCLAMVVAVDILGTIWLGACYRATVSYKLMPADQDTGKKEH